MLKDKVNKTNKQTNCYILLCLLLLLRIQMPSYIHTRGTFNDYVAKKRWVGGPKLLIFCQCSGFKMSTFCHHRKWVKTFKCDICVLECWRATWISILHRSWEKKDNQLWHLWIRSSYKYGLKCHVLSVHERKKTFKWENCDYSCLTTRARRGG